MSVDPDVLEQLVRDAFSDQWWYSPQMPLDEVLIRARARLSHDHDEKCSVVVENLRQLRADRGFTLSESRAILVADEALGVSYDVRLSSGHVLGFEEREAWVKLVEIAQARVTAHARLAQPTRPMINGRAHCMMGPPGYRCSCGTTFDDYYGLAEHVRRTIDCPRCGASPADLGDGEGCRWTCGHWIAARDPLATLRGGDSA